jgi:photosystem II stability/assembly factor-like uncharacterized protein
MAQEFDFVLTNPTATESQVGILSPTELNSQKSTKFRAVTPYTTSYPVNSTFIFRTNDTPYTYQPQTITTPQDIVNQFNNQFDIGDVSLFANNAIDGTVYEIVSPYSFIELEINLTVFTWVAQTATTNGNTGVSFINSLEGIISCFSPSGYILNTSDGGLNWIATNAGGATSFMSLKALPSGIGFVCGFSGVIYKTNDIHSILAWTAQTSGTVQNLYSIFFINDNTGWVCGDNGVIRATINGGANWNGQTSGLLSSLFSIYFIDANNGWACGVLGKILKTTNGGASWNPQSSGISSDLTSIYFIDANNGWACGANEIVLNTIDGGANWTNETLGSGIENLMGICFPTLTMGWVVGGDTSFNNIIYKYS